MKLLLIAATIAFSVSAGAQIQISNEGYVTTAEQRIEVLQAYQEISKYCNAKNLSVFTLDMQKQYRKGLVGVEMRDIPSMSLMAKLCKQGHNMVKAGAAPYKEEAAAHVTKPVPATVKASINPSVKGAMYGLDMETSTPREIYMSTTNKAGQDALIALEKQDNWQMKVLPSFDCSKAVTKTDLTICGDPYLSLLDQELSSSYKQAMKNAKLTGDPEWLKTEQRKWNKKMQGVSFASELAYRQATRINYLKDDTADSTVPSW